MSPATVTAISAALSTNEPSTQADLLMFDVMHQAMRTQSRALAVALGALDPTDRAGAEELQAWYTQMLAGIEHHHTVEDTIFFPMMVAHDPAAEALQATMASDHHVLDEHLVAVSESLAALVVVASDGALVASMPERYAASVRDDAVRATEALVACLDDHLDREEAETFPIFLASVPRVAMEQGHGQAMGDDGKKVLPFIAPWLLPSASPEQQAALLGGLPRLVRTVLRFVWVPRYTKAYPRIVAAQRQVLAEQASEAMAAA
ncbi:MAG: hemerythrin cation binding domain protein [Acidimicrobiales bacterium]|nr:hemerythrin cation binding domain protein [Acidimicrobiales bacterium]